MVFVGALNVGKMCFTFDSTIQTNAKGDLQQCYMYDNVNLLKGSELGHFEMGSTIVMLFEKESIELQAKEIASIRFGMNLGLKNLSLENQRFFREKPLHVKAFDIN